ncbi:hypothetical protein H0H93_000305 [Arthromyces matolae]|nr:hypothetical protein H0H93_000305 [Arthromyces matolae]
MPSKGNKKPTEKASPPRAKKKSTKTAKPKNGHKRKAPDQESSRSNSPSLLPSSSAFRTHSNSAGSLSVPADAGPDSPLHALRNFFGTKMRKLEKGKGHTKSTQTRTPGFFDKHLEEIIRLNRVVHLPTIAKDLKIVADQAVHAFPAEKLPPPVHPFPTIQTMIKVQDEIDSIVIQKELEVQQIYALIANKCLDVAATLAYPNSNGTWASSLLKWTSSPLKKKESSAADNQATPDGLLNFDDDPGPTLKKSTDTKAPVIARSLISDYDMRALVLAEIKNLNFCEIATLHEIVEKFNDGQFPWVCCELGAKCCTEHSPNPTEEHVGWDARNHVCQSMREARERRDKSMHADLPYVDEFSQGSRDLLQQAWASAVRYDATFILIHAGNAEIIAIRDRQTQTLFVSDVIQVNNFDDYLQMHVGLYIAAIRDAEDRAFTRATTEELPLTWTPPGRTGVLDLTKLNHEETRIKLLEAASEREWLKIKPKKTALYHPFTQELYHSAHGSDILLRQSPPLSPSSQESPPSNFEDFYLFFPTPSSTETSFSVENYGVDVDPPERNTFFELQAEPSFYGQRTCRASLRLKDVAKHPSFSLAHHPILVIKNALEPEDISCLLKERDTIISLRDENVPNVPKIHWLFRCPDKSDPDKQFVVLILEDMGVSLAERESSYWKLKRKRMKASWFVSQDDARIFMEILQSWHRAGFVHGKLSKATLMFRIEGAMRKLCIVGFKHAEYVKNVDSLTREKMFDDNNRQMRGLLGI